MKGAARAILGVDSGEACLLSHVGCGEREEGDVRPKDWRWSHETRLTRKGSCEGRRGHRKPSASMNREGCERENALKRAEFKIEKKY